MSRVCLVRAVTFAGNQVSLNRNSRLKTIDLETLLAVGANYITFGAPSTC